MGRGASLRSSAGRRRLDPAVRRAELLEAGEAVVRRLGLAARIEHVTAAAGAARATFYVYFPTWEAFLEALQARAYASLSERFEAVIAAQADWVGLVGGLPKAVLDLTLSLEGLHAAFHAAARASPYGSELTARLTELLEAGRAEKALTFGDAAATARLVQALLHETADQILAGAPAGPALEACRAFLLAGLKAQPRPVGRATRAAGGAKRGQGSPRPSGREPAAGAHGSGRKA